MLDFPTFSRGLRKLRPELGTPEVRAAYEQRYGVKLPEERGLLGEIGAGLAAGAYGLGGLAGTGVRLAGKGLGSEGMETFGGLMEAAGEERAAKFPASPSISGSPWDDPSLLLNPKFYLRGIGEFGPSMLLPMGAGGMAARAGLGTLGRAAAASAAGAPLFGLDAARMAEQAGNDPGQAFVGQTVAAGLLGMLPMSQVFGGGNLARRAIGGAVGQGLSMGLMQPTQRMAALGEDPVTAFQRAAPAMAQVGPIAALTGLGMGVVGDPSRTPIAPPQRSPAREANLPAQEGVPNLAELAVAEPKAAKYGKTAAPLKNKAGDYRRNAAGDIAGAPPGIKTEADVDALVRKITAHLDHPLSATAPEDGSPSSLYWYDRSGEGIREVTRGNRRQMERMVRLLAYLSADNQVGGNVTGAIKALHQFERGKTMEAGRYPDKLVENGQAIMSAKVFDKRLTGVSDKVMNFYRNLHDATFRTNKYANAGTMDVWMSRLLGYPEMERTDYGKVTGTTARLGPAQYRFANMVNRRVTDLYNQQKGTKLLPRQIQAGLWAYARNAGLDPEFTKSASPTKPKPYMDFGTYLQRAEQHVTFEATPSTSLKTAQWLAKAPWKVREEYARRVLSATSEPGGRDGVLERIMVPLYRSQRSVGTYEGALNPNRITSITSQKKTIPTGRLNKQGKPTTEAEVVTDDADLYALAQMYIHSQDAVPWFQLDHTATGGVRGAYAEFSKRPTPRALDAFYRHLRKFLPDAEFTLLDNKVLAINYGWADKDSRGPGSVNDKKFQDLFHQAAESYTGPGAKAILNVVTDNVKAWGKYHGIWDHSPAGWQDPAAASAALEKAISDRGRSDLLPYLRSQRDLVERARAAFAREHAQRAKRPREIGLDVTIPKDIREKGATSLVGKKVRSAKDLGTLAQVYRNPKYETLRYFFVNDKNVVVGQTGVSSRMPDSAALFPGSEKVDWVVRQMQNVGARRLWMLHNHPSAGPKPSTADVRATWAVNDALKSAGMEVAGHVVINHDAFASIKMPPPANANVVPWEIIQTKAGAKGIEDPFAKASRPHPVLGTVISNPNHAMLVGKMLTHLQGADTDWLVVVGRKAQTGGVRTIMEVPASTMRDFARGRAILRQIRRQTGSADAMVVDRGNVIPAALQDRYIGEGHALDWVSTLPDGTMQSRMQEAAPPVVESPSPPGRVVSVSDTAAPYADEPPLRTRARTRSPEDVIEHSRRHVQPWHTTQELADALGVSEAELMKFMRRKVGKSFNAEELLQSGAFVDDLHRKVESFSTDYVDKMKAGTISDADRTAAMELQLDAVTQIAQFLGVRAEAGRALQIFRKLQTVVDKAEYMRSAYGEDSVDARMLALSTMPTRLQRARFMRKTATPTTMDKVLEAWINGLLSGPATHIVNTTSNTLVQVLEDVERTVAAGLGIFHSGDKVGLDEAAARIMAWGPGTAKGVDAFWAALKSEDAVDLFGKMEAGHARAIAGTKGKVIRLPGRFLNAEDMFFKGLTAHRELVALAHRQARNTGENVEDILANPPDALLEQAWKAARVSTFTNPLGTLGQSIQRILTRHKLLRFIVPFIRTPSNIVKFAAHRSPLAPLFEEVRAELAAGGARRDLALSRIATGSALGAMTMSLVAAGLVTGGAPDDPRERALWMRTRQPYSIRVGDRWYSYGRLEPLGMIFGISADMMQLGQKMDAKTVGEMAELMTGSFARNIASKTWLRGLTDVIHAMSDPERYGQNWIQSFSGTLIPTGMAQVAHAEDPYLRRATTIMDTLKARIPGMSQELPVRHDVFGEPIKFESSAFSPIRSRSAAGDPVVSELQRLSIFPSMQGKRIGQYTLQPADREGLAAEIGQAQQSILRRVVGSPGYQRMPDWLRAEVLRKQMSMARRIARIRWLFTHDATRAAVQRAKVKKKFRLQ